MAETQEAPRQLTTSEMATRINEAMQEIESAKNAKENLATQTQEAPRQLSTLEMATRLNKAEQEIHSGEEAKKNLTGRNEFMRGMVRGTDQLQATYQGGIGMVNSLIGNDAAAARRFSNYQDEMRQSTENPATVDKFFSSDPKSGAMASPGNFGTWVAGTAGSLIPSVAESALSGVAGAAAGSMLVPGPDPTDFGTVPVGFASGMFAKGAVKKAIAEAAEQYIKQGAKREAAERMGTQAVHNIIAKRTGATLAAQQSTAMNEGGGFYMEGREKGYDNPVSALALGQVSGASEVSFGVFPKALGMAFKKAGVAEVAKKSGARVAAGYMWDIGQEFLQEAFQEGLGIINEGINDPKAKIFTKENFMKLAESGMAGALGGAMFGVGGAATSAYQNRGQQPPPPPPGENRDMMSQNTQVPPTLPPNRDMMSQNGTQPPTLPTEAPVDPVMEGLTPEAIQRLGALDAPPKAHKWADVVHGDRKRYTEAPKPEVIIQQWEAARAAVTGVETGYVQPKAVANQAEEDAFAAQEFARRRAEKAGTQPPIAPEATPVETPPQASPIADDTQLKFKIRKPMSADAYLSDVMERHGNLDGLKTSLTMGRDHTSNMGSSFLPILEGATDQDLLNYIAQWESKKAAFPQPATASPPATPETTPPQNRDIVSQNPPASESAPPVVKAPWELTRSEHVAERERLIGEFRMLSEAAGGGPNAMKVPEVAAAFRAQEEWSDLDIGHKPAVQKAVKEGKPVPALVLAEYPNIATPSKVTPSTEVAKPPKSQGKKPVEQPATADSPKFDNPSDQQKYDDIRQKMSNLRNPPSPAIWAEIVNGDRTNRSGMPDEPTIRKQWEDSRTAFPVRIADQFGKPIPQDVVDYRKEFVNKAKAGSRFTHSGYEGSLFEVGDNGDLTETMSARGMGNVVGMADVLKPGQVKWQEPTEKVPPVDPEVKLPASKPKSLLDTPVTDNVREWTDEDNIRHEMFESVDGKSGIVRSVDIDSGNVVSITKHPSVNSARNAFNKAIKPKQQPETKISDIMSQNPKPETTKGGDSNGKVKTEGQTKAQAKADGRKDVLGSKGDQATGEAPSSGSSVRKAIIENGGHEKNSADDVEAIRKKLYDGANTPSHADIRAVMQTMKNEAGQGKKPIRKPKSEWEQGVADLLETVPAFKGASSELSEAKQTVKVTRPDGRTTTIHFGADKIVDALAKKKGAERWDGAYIFKSGRKNDGHIYLRLRPINGQTYVLNHEVVHWLEDEGIITQAEVEKHGGREGIAEAYGDWIAESRPANTLFEKIYDFLERIFDVNVKFFKELTDRVDASKANPSEFDDAALKALDAILQAESPKPKSVKKDIRSEKAKSGQQALDARPKKSTGVKKPLKSEQTLAEAKTDMQAAHDAAAKLMEKIRSKLMSGVDPELMAETVQVAYLYTKANVKTFKGYVQAIIENFGEAFAREFAPYMESGWKALNTRDIVKDPAGKVSDYLEKDYDNQNESGADTNSAMEDGVGQHDGDGSTVGDAANEGRDAKGDTGQEGDPLLRDNGKTAKGNGREGSGGIGTDGNTDSGQSEKGQPDSADSGRGSDAESVADQRAVNHVIGPDDDIAVASLTESLKRNIKALDILKKLESEGLFPDEAQRNALAQYTGWGGLSQALDSIKGERMLKEQEWNRDENWEKKWGPSYLKLKDLLSKEDFQAAQDSTENAHYTSKPIIQSLWKIAERLGFDGGRVLELGAGIGHFAGLVPANVRGQTKFVMVERDGVSSRIIKMLYPRHDVVAGDMEQFRAVPGSVTIGIGNVPFAGGTVGDSVTRYKEDLNLHNYSIARHLDAVAPGGIVVVISTHNTLDSNIKQRKFLASKGELIGAIRLPNDAFAENAKTEVVTDVLIFRRPRQGDGVVGVRFDQDAKITVKNKDGKEVVKSVNKYFIDNPEMVLGVHSAKGSMYGADEYTVNSTAGSLQSKLDVAIEKLPKDLLGKVDITEKVLESDKTVPFGRLEIRASKVVMGFGDKFVPIEGKKFEEFPVHLTGKTGVERAKNYIELRDLLTNVRNVMLSETASDDAVKRSQMQLSKSYDRYVDKHGPLNSGKTNIFVRDPDFYRVLALENEKSSYNPETKKIEVTYEKASIFTERVLGPQKEPESAASAADAVAISTAWKGSIDSAFVGKLLGVAPKEAEAKLIDEGLAFRNPTTTELELSDLYLSGNVRAKLEQAKISAAEDPQYERNIEELTKVMPKDVTIKKDTVRLGATWIPEHVINAFATQAFGTEVNVSYNANTDAWSVPKLYGFSETAKAKYKTDRIQPDEVLAETLNLRSIKVYDRKETGEFDAKGKPKTTQVLNEKETQAAKHRASVLRADFEKWVLESHEVSDSLARIYNDKYNNFVRTKYNGDFLVLPGANPEVKLRPYQLDAIWRIINRGTALLAHAVGSGKTYTMIVAAMEMRRLGLARRPLLVVQNATLGQFATSFQKMYPNANVLVANKEDLGKGKRQLFLNKVSTGNWDAVVMAQSTFDNMASDPEVERAFIQDQLDLLEEAIREEGGENTKTPTVKQLVRTKKSLKNRFDSLMGSRAKKEDNVTFEEMGADALFLDEAHAYKKPTFTTKLSQLVGLNVEASARSLATTIKVRSIQSAHNGRNVVLATGTPVTNTLGEGWHMVNYVSPATNAAFSSRTFDQFIGNFAQVEPTLTMNAGGKYVYKDAIVKFRNGRQLVEYINDSWDIVTPDALRAYMTDSGTGFPTLRNGQPSAITVDRTPGVAAFMDYISRVYDRFKDLPAKERRAMSFIPAIAYGASKAATLDIRMVVPGAKEEKNSKLQKAVDEVKRIYDETSDVKGTQLFFSDMKNPFNMNRLTQFMGGEAIDAFEEDDVNPDAEEESVSDDDESGSFLYQELRKKLIAKGIPVEQIAFIADAKTDKQRQALFERVNNGDIRVLIGSTAKMGVGVNVQDKLAAIHHFDTPWLPADLEQREGRILRFRNENAVVEILRYAMKKTLDGAIYMSTSRKQKFIWQVLNGNLDGDSFDDPSSASMLSIEEQLAAIQDDPVFFEKIEIQNRLRELELERQSFFDAQRRVASSLAGTKSNLDYAVKTTIPLQEDRIKRVEKYKADGVLDTFSMDYEGEKFTDAKKAAELIKDKVEELRKYVMKNFDNIKTIYGSGGVLSLNEAQKVRFKLGPVSVTIGAGPQYLSEYVDGKSVTRSVAQVQTIIYFNEPMGRTYEIYSGTATVPSTLLEKMETLPEDVQRELNSSLSDAEKAREKIKELEGLIGKEWEDQAEYDTKKSRLSEIETQMLASGGSLRSDKPVEKTVEEEKLDEKIKDIPPDVMYQTDDVNDSIRVQALDIAFTAEDAGIKTFDQLVAYSVKTVGERRTREIGAYLKLAAKHAGFAGIRQVGDVLGTPNVTREQAATFAKAAFPMLSDEQTEAGVGIVERLGLLDNIGFAPAGSPTPEQSLKQRSLQTNTPEFKRWFGDSKVVDADGKPLVMYHGTDKDFNVFENRGGKVTVLFSTFDVDRKGFFFAKDKGLSLEYGSKLVPVYLSIQKPANFLDGKEWTKIKDGLIEKGWNEKYLDITDAWELFDVDDVNDGAKLIKDLKSMGYDGAIIEEPSWKDENGEYGISHVAFDNTQIKSATGNVGTFDPANPNILMQNQTQGGNVKGWTSFITATRAIIGATNKADVSTFIHEIAHPMRRFLLNREVPQDKRADITDDEILSLENVLGVENGKWEVEHEEKFAKMWEQYWFEGKPPKNATPELQSLFKKIAKWMHGVYQSIQEITGVQLPVEVRALFDKLVQRGDGEFRDTMSQNEDPDITSIKNALVNERRFLRGIPALADVASQTQEEWLEAANDLLQDDPMLGDQLVKEINTKARNLSNVEVAVMQIHYRGMNNRLEKVSDRLFKAKDAKDAAESAKALIDVDIVMNALVEIEEATKAAGREWARAGVARKIELEKDFSLAAVMRKARIANGGNALSEKQLGDMRELARKVAELEGKLAKAVQEKLDLERRRNVEAQIEDSKTKVEPVPESIRKKVVDKLNAFKSKFASASASSSKTDSLFATEDEQMADEAKSVIQEYVDIGISTIGELLSNLRKDWGSDIPVSVKAAFATAWKEMHDNGDIPVPMVDKNDVRGLSRLAKQIERSLVEAGITKLEDVVKGVRESLQEIIPDITERETMDALSGYGQYSAPSEDQDDKIIADINGRLLELAKLDDMNAGIAPSRTGKGRQEISDAHRELIRKVNIAKREGKYQVTDPDMQLKSAVSSAKTALVNRIHDLNKAINVTKQPIVSSAKTDLAGKDEGVIALRKERDELMAVYKTMFPKPGATMEQRIAATAKALDRVADSLEKQMETRNFETKKKSEPISTEELDAKRARIDALRAQREDIKEYKEWNEERKSKAYKANLLKQIADYQDRALHSFYGPKPKKEARVLSPEEMLLKLELKKVKDEFFRLAADYRLANMSPREKAWDYVKETAHLSRALMTSLDFSAVFRQGGAVAFSHPKMAAETSKEMYKAMLSEASQFATAEAIRNDGMYQFAMTAKLGLTEEEGQIVRQEEAFAGRLARNGIGAQGTKLNAASQVLLSPITASARGYTTFLNGVRFALFKHMVANLGKGGQVTLDEAKVIAFYINAATGRSELGPMMKWAEQANMLFFAPRFVASRFQYLGMPLWLLGSNKVSGRVKKAIAMEYIRHSAGVMSFLALTVALGSLLGGDDEDEKPTVSLDPRSSDFLKIKWGETRIDPMSGLSQVITLMGRIASGQRVGADGKVIDLRGEDVPYGGLGMAGTVGNFVRTKFAPVPGAAFDIASGENVVGQKVTPFSSIINLFIPLSLREINDTAQSRGIPQTSLIALVSLHGMGASTYGPKSNYRKATPEDREKQFGKDLKKMTFDSGEPSYKGLLSKEQIGKVDERLENRKQGLVYAASAAPVRKAYKNEETYKTAVAERDVAMGNLKKSGMTLEESRKLLIKHWESQYGSAKEMRGGVRVYKEALSNRLKQLRKEFQQ